MFVTLRYKKGGDFIKSTYTGNIRLIKDFYSPELGNSRNIIIYLPPDYETTDKHYAVLYMHDGQNIFDASTSYSGIEWEADETAEKLISAEAIEPVIIVGIYNTGSNRVNEYSPWIDKNYGGGKGELYAQFVVNTVKPFIDGNFRTLPERENTAIAGSSLGGLISLYIGLKHNNIFSKIGAMSPAFWFADKSVFSFIEASEFQYKTTVYMDIGTQENPKPETYISDARKMHELLLKKENVEIMYLEDEGATHSESSWAKRFHKLVLYFFGKFGK